MNKRLVLLIVSCFTGAAALAGALFCEKRSDARLIRPTQNYTDEMILSLPYFDLLAPKGENRNLASDVISYSLGDGYIHLLLPENVSSKAVVVYIRDIDGNYLARRVFDFTQKVVIGPWEVLLEHHNLPVLYFETGDHAIYEKMIASEKKDIICDGNMHLCVSRKNSKENGWYREYFSISEGKFAGVSASLQGRGSTSWTEGKKKSYSLRMKKAVNLLGMGKNKNWNLIGNSSDPTLLKNLIFNDLSKNIGIDYQPEMRSINLYVDGVYQGVYLLTTKISVDKDRVALRQGDYFYRMDPPIAQQGIEYSSSTWFEDGGTRPLAELLYPENVSEEDFERASMILQSFIDAVESEDPDMLESVCDVESLSKYYWIQEASMNFDAWQRSVYMYYNKNDGKIHMGPVWDMDRTLGSIYVKEGVDASFDSPYGWKVRYGGWYRSLFKNRLFIDRVSYDYYEGGVRETLINSVKALENYRNDLGEDAELDYIFYGHTPLAHLNGIYVNTDNYDEYFEDMSDFYKNRVNWIDKNMK